MMKVAVQARGIGASKARSAPTAQPSSIERPLAPRAGSSEAAWAEPRIGPEFSRVPIHADSSPPSIFVQRLVDDHPTECAAGASGLVGEALASPARRLDAQTRAFMEPRFGHDFSGVRIHADSSAARAAWALNARAFTVADDIVFGDGHYAPSTSSGQRVLAHELAHVVQQRSGIVTGQPGPGGLSLSDPADRFERAAEKAANAVRSGSAGAGPARRTTPGAPSAGRGPHRIQRFLAGEAGHGGIEEDALEESGFSKKEAHQTYYGNWQRDFSQVLDAQSPSGGVALEVIRILATGEFGREPTSEEMGRYLPSEHVDNPGGGQSAENPFIDAATFAKRLEALGPTQRAWVEEERTQTFKNEIKKHAAASGLPEYIEVAKAHVKRQIAEAATLGRNERGLRALGNGLHAVEDYFAHSNFVEVALDRLARQGLLPANARAVLAARTNIVVDPAKNKTAPIANVGTDRFGRPAIVTGTSTPGAGDTVGKWEAIKTELQNHEMRRIFLRGAVIRYGWQAPERVGRWAGAHVGRWIGGALGAVGGAIGGLFKGAGAGAARGWSNARHWWQKPFAALGGLFAGAARGAAAGATTGLESGRRVGGEIGGGVGAFVGRAASLGVAPAVAAVVFSLMTLLTLGTEAAGGPLERRARRKIAQGTRETVSNRDPRTTPLPTHSQIAKDDPDHPLHAAAARLAHLTDSVIGKKMIEVWQSGGDSKKVAQAQALVDIYLAHPNASDWWKPALLAAVTAARRPPP